MDTLQKIWEYKDLRKKILLTILILLLTRFLAHVPLPGVDLARMQSFFSQNQVFGLLNMFSGGTMSNFSIILMGVGPYINASIIFQLLGMIIPSIEEIQKDGEAGRQKITQWTRMATVPLAMIQGYGMLVLLQNQGIIPSWTIFDLIVMIISITAGTLILMWLGEIITSSGVGNGMSLIIGLGILSGLPAQIRNTSAIISSGDTSKIIGIIVFVIVVILTISAVIFIQEGQRNIPVTYARKMRQGANAATNSYLPIRVNIAGVIPIIFAMSILIIPGVIAKYLENAHTPWIVSSAKFITESINNQTIYGILYFLLVIAFTYFYTSVVFKPSQIAENLQKQGGFVPGIRPGTETINYLQKIILRITFSGAVFLGIIAVLPIIVQSVTNINTLALGGTGILIVVSVVIEVSRQINSLIMMHTYDRY
ncbi:MAG: preprotein translocase subunit SecY [bacterium]